MVVHWQIFHLYTVVAFVAMMVYGDVSQPVCKWNSSINQCQKDPEALMNLLSQTEEDFAQMMKCEYATTQTMCTSISGDTCVWDQGECHISAQYLVDTISQCLFSSSLVQQTCKPELETAIQGHTRIDSQVPQPTSCDPSFLSSSTITCKLLGDALDCTGSQYQQYEYCSNINYNTTANQISNDIGYLFNKSPNETYLLTTYLENQLNIKQGNLRVYEQCGQLGISSCENFGIPPPPPPSPPPPQPPSPPPPSPPPPSPPPPPPSPYRSSYFLFSSPSPSPYRSSYFYLSSPSPSPSPPPQSKKKDPKDNSMIILVAIAIPTIVCVVLCGGFWFIARKDRELVNQRNVQSRANRQVAMTQIRSTVNNTSVPERTLDRVITSDTNEPSAPYEQPQDTGVVEKMLAVLPTFEQSAAPMCAICFDDIQEGDIGTILPCGHKFHQKCFQQWLETKGAEVTCPMCNLQLAPQLNQKN